MKREFIWWTVFFFVALLATGQITDFEFRAIEVQLHDSYFVIPSWIGFAFILTILGLLRRLTNLIDKMINKNRVTAIWVSVITGFIGIILIILIYESILTLMRLKEWYPDLNISNYKGIVVIMILLLLSLMTIEVKSIKK